MKNTIQKIAMAPALSGLGGMVTFQVKFRQELERRGIPYSFNLHDPELQALLVIGGTRSILRLPKSRRDELHIVQRLDGINWMHRKTRTGARHWLRAETGNLLLRYIRNSLANRVVYQSQFVQDWWHEQHGRSPGIESVIHNGADLEHFSPRTSKHVPSKQMKILMVEGNIRGGYELGLNMAIELVNELVEKHAQDVVLRVAGDAERAAKREATSNCRAEIEWLDVLENAELPAHYRAADMLFSADLNAACPNAVIEALACGLPVVAFSTGALPELLDEDSGALADYGGDPWELEPADIPGLAEAALKVFGDNVHYREGARARAEAAFDLRQMTESYLDVLLGDE